MSTHMPGFQSFFSCLHHFEMAKLATSSMRVIRARSGRCISTLLGDTNLFNPTRLKAGEKVGSNPGTR